MGNGIGCAPLFWLPVVKWFVYNSGSESDYTAITWYLRIHPLLLRAPHPRKTLSRSESPLPTQVKRYSPLPCTNRDYRGLFGSCSGDINEASLSIRDSAEDARELLDELGVEELDVFVGWSTGVQVGLELALQCVASSRVTDFFFFLTTILVLFFSVCPFLYS
jgi:hypothetical protein